ncbi:aldehyde dehydrogenase family protein [Kutzneria kofuensis]|uniref:Acyl-CoA reductase-like NAD-dependent aldehyde dehydrogenase n=1 Tax=Kutzneria kofuensis TaxID=103725 RepID=A0A7W9KMZ2_9PSEU|nr:aldehyde dehydrogenase family protein [Kutzneria kofuensis]MBB5895544.1 acyl-CoA reductase-like NAD-dependent aldehyde dehydrogenase [Kutzneria kofuensis]
MFTVDALGPSGPYRARKQLVITDVTGGEVASVSLVPRLFVTRTMSALHKASAMPLADRRRALTIAGSLFAEDSADYVELVTRVSGLPRADIQFAAETVAQACGSAYEAACQGRPVGACESVVDEGGVWTRRGSVFAVHAAGNHPAVHSLWLQALALGYRVAVRPSRREPFTPYRLISALRTAGFGDDQVVLLPCEHDVADEILRSADLGMVYGGDEVIAKYGSNPRVLPQGPGRSKVLVTDDWEPALDVIVSSIAHHGGVGCINATGVLIEGDPAPLATALAARLSALPDSVLPRYPLAGALALRDHLAKRATGTQPLLGADQLVTDLGDGSAVIRPALHLLPSADAPQLGAELPFPCAWVAPWNRADIAPLRNTLVLTAITRDEELIADLLDEPTIANLYVGNRPTHYFHPQLPHDSYLSDFLMRTKAVARTPGESRSGTHRM